MWMTHPSIPGSKVPVATSTFTLVWQPIGWAETTAPTGPAGSADSSYLVTRGELQTALAGVSGASVDLSGYQQSLPVVATVTAAGELARDRHTPVDASAGALTLTLPTPTRVGQQVRVEKVDASANAVAVTGTLRGAAVSVSMPWQYEVRTFVAESLTSWRIASGQTPKPALDSAYQQVWKANTTYAQGVVVTSPEGRLVKAKVAFTSGATFDLSNWTVIGDLYYAPLVAGFLLPEQYGAQGDGRVVQNAATTAGSTTVTAAGAGFTAADVGKRVVVTRAGASTGPLSTTITAVTDASTIVVALAATGTTTGQDLTWGTDDTTALQAAITAAAVAHTTLQLGAKRYLFTHLDITGSCTIAGAGVHGLFGKFADGLGNFTPLVPPFLTGTVLTCIANGQVAAIDIPTEAIHVNLRDFGLMWASPFKATGHGIRAVAGSGKNGLTCARWESLFCWGHDGNSYAWYLQNNTKSHFEHLRSYGGGLLYFEQNGGSQYGNTNFVDMEGKLFCGGTAHVTHLVSQSGDWTRMAFIGCEFNAVSGRAYPPITKYDFVDPASPQCNFKSAGATTLRGLSLLSPAFDTVGVTIEPPDFPGAVGAGGFFLDPGGWYKNLGQGVDYPAWAYGSSAMAATVNVPRTSTASLSHPATSLTTHRLINAASGAVTVTLPLVSTAKSRMLTVKKVDSSANAVTVAVSGSATIDGASSYVLSAQYAFVTLLSDGTTWSVVGKG